MYTKYLFAILGAIVIVFGIGAYVVLTTPLPQQPGATVPNPFTPGAILPNTGGSQHVGTTTGTVTTVMPVGLKKGGTINVREFTKDSDAQIVVSPRTQQSYYALGSLPLTDLVASTTASTTKTALEQGYEILYFPEEHSFSIVLLKEPISETRQKMQSDLEYRLGLTEPDLCTLVADVYVAKSANKFYGNKKVGFAHCPGAVTLPGD